MAIGDINSVTVRSLVISATEYDGWSVDVVIAGFTTGATYDFGSLDSSPATTATPKFTMTVVSEGYSSSGVLGTVTRTVYGTHVVRVPFSTATIAGSFTSGTFLDGESVSQAVSGATAVIVGGQAAGATLRVKTVAGTPNSANIWTGGTSGATFTPSATPVTLPANTKDELYDGTNLKVRVSLSENVYADDKNGGAGTSGTNPTVTIAASWATNTGGASQPSNVATNLSCTNNSTRAYPKVVAQWAWGHTPAWRQVTAQTSIGCIAYHGHGIACVALSATDAHSAVVSGTATTKTAHTMSASGLCYESYDLTVPVSSFTAGDDVTLRYIAYPTVGDAACIIDTSTNTTAKDDVRGLTQITFTYNPTVTTKYVAQNGSDATGDGSSGNPYATIGKALAQNPGLIYVKAGGTNVVDFIGLPPASVTQFNYFIDVKPNPGDEATVSLTRTTTGVQYKAKLLRYSEFTITGGSGWFDGNNVTRSKVWFENCTMSVASLPTVGLSYQNDGCWFVNCTETSGLDHYIPFSTNITGYQFTGCNHTKGGKIRKSGSCVASKFAGNGADTLYLQGNSNGAQTLLENNMIYLNNRLTSVTVSAEEVMQMGDLAAVSGAAIIGNVVEVKTVSSSQPALWTAADSTAVTTNNVIVAHNSIVGERYNCMYNDIGTTPYLKSNIFIRNNAFGGFAIKSDTFGTQSGNRIGNWETMNGVNCSDNRYSGRPALSTFLQDYYGINITYTTAVGTFGQLGYTTDNSADGAGTGNGNYKPTVGSTLLAQTLRQKYQSYDLMGTALN